MKEIKSKVPFQETEDNKLQGEWERDIETIMHSSFCDVVESKCTLSEK